MADRPTGPALPARAEVGAPDAGPADFAVRFEMLFDEHFQRVVRILDRLSGDAELAADVTQDAFLRLLRRGSVPDSPAAWLITVALNLLRNARTMGVRRRRLLTAARGWAAHSDAPPAPGRAAEAEATRYRVRRALDRLPERERSLLLLQAEGYAYREIAAALQLNEASIGTLLARARRAFRENYGDADRSPG